MTKNNYEFSKALTRFSTYTVLVWPVRILIIVSAVMIPVLLGLIIFFYIKNRDKINEVLKRTATIEGFIYNNIKEGIHALRDVFDGNLDPVNDALNNYIIPVFKQFFKDNYGIDIGTIDFSSIVTDIGNRLNTELKDKGIQELSKIKIDDIITKEYREEIIDKIKEAFPNDSDKITEAVNKFFTDNKHTLAYLITQFKLFH